MSLEGDEWVPLSPEASVGSIWVSREVTGLSVTEAP